LKSAAEYFQFSADQNHVIVQFRYDINVLDGTSVSVDMNKPIHDFQFTALKGLQQLNLIPIFVFGKAKAKAKAKTKTKAKASQ
jgi:hypothetical protein